MNIQKKKEWLFGKVKYRKVEIKIKIKIQSKAYIDMTGGIQEAISSKDFTESKLWKILTKAKSKDSLMGCSILVSIFALFIDLKRVDFFTLNIYQRQNQMKKKAN